MLEITFYWRDDCHLIYVHWVEIYICMNRIEDWWAQKPNTFWSGILGLELRSSPVSGYLMGGLGGFFRLIQIEY